MKRITLSLALASLATTAWAQAPASHADRMRKCAAEWRTHKQSAAQRPRYQQFMSDCMKAVAASGPATAPK